jgi:hypothetical protein
MALAIPNYSYITHKLVQRPWGPTVRFTVGRSDGPDINEVLPISSMQAKDSELVTVISAYLAKWREMEQMERDAQEREANTCRDFDNSGEEVRKALHWLVRKIRQYPNATVTQAETQWNAEWADSLFTWDKLVTFMRNKVGGMTWAEFKTYVINHRFEGVD